MGAEHTSVPRWGRERPAPDPATRALLLIGFGARGAAITTGWAADAPAGRPVEVLVADSADESVLAVLVARIAAARVGWRLMLAGPEVDVLAARAVAVREGVLDAEIRCAVTGAERKRVFCPHCRTTTSTTAPVSGETPCDGCGRRLHVYAHVSRRAGAYLGFMADAEEVA
ncbi:dimethylamine monooxygenase subunit DmmA family protein [Blastococcus sp. SYSU D01042]